MIRSASVSDIGRLRKINQDTVFTRDSSVGFLSNLYIVADGMGGHNAGDYASIHAVEAVVNNLEGARGMEIFEAFGAGMRRANRELFEKSSAEKDYYGMGTTMVCASIHDHRLYVANVGDSRLYVAGDGLRQVTVDHSLVEEMVRMGEIERSQARNHPDKNIITRAIGATQYVDPDFFSIEVWKDDIILMCSDGLTNMVEEDDILNIIREKTELRARAEKLVEAANNAGGKDNISVILVDPFG